MSFSVLSSLGWTLLVLGGVVHFAGLVVIVPQLHRRSATQEEPAAEVQAMELSNTAQHIATACLVCGVVILLR